MCERDRDRVLAELALLADRARALVGETVVADPDPHRVHRAARLLRLDRAAELAARRLDGQHPALGEALLAALERSTADDDRDRVAVKDRSDTKHEVSKP